MTNHGFQNAVKDGVYILFVTTQYAGTFHHFRERLVYQFIHSWCTVGGQKNILKNMSTPSTPDDLLFDREFVETVRDWIVDCTRDPVGVLLIEQGQSGAGISTMWTVFESSIPNIAFVHEPDCGVGTHNVIGQKNVFLFDDMDAAISSPVVMKRIMDCIDQQRVPVIIAGYYRRGTKSKLTAALKKHKHVITCPVPRVMGRVAIPYLEQLGHPEANRAWYDSGGDLRQCIRTIRVGDVTHNLPDGIDALTELLGPPERSFVDRARIASGDPTIITSGIFENYTKAVRPTDLETCARILDSIEAVADLENAMYDDPTREFQPYIASIMGGVPSLGPLALRQPIVTYGTHWAKSNHAQAKRLSERDLARSMCLEKTDFPWVRSMVFDANERRKSNPDASRVLPLDGFTSEDLWKCVTLFQPGAKRRKYTKSQHVHTFPVSTPPAGQ